MGILLSCCIGPRQKDPPNDQIPPSQQLPGIERDLRQASARSDHDLPHQPHSLKQVVYPRTENQLVYDEETFNAQKNVPLARSPQSNDYPSETPLKYASRNSPSHHPAAYSLEPLPLDPREPSPFLIWMENRYGPDYESAVRKVRPLEPPLRSSSSSPPPATRTRPVIDLTDLSSTPPPKDHPSPRSDEGHANLSGVDFGVGSGW